MRQVVGFAVVHLMTMRVRLRWLVGATLVSSVAFSFWVAGPSALNRQIEATEGLASSAPSTDLQKILETVIAERLFAHLETQYAYDGTYFGKEDGKQKCPPLPRPDQDKYLPRMPSKKCGFRFLDFDQYVVLEQFERPTLRISAKGGVHVAIKIRAYVRIRKTNCLWRDCGDDRYYWTNLRWRGSFIVHDRVQQNGLPRFGAEYEYGDIATDSSWIRNLVLDVIEAFARNDIEKTVEDAINYTYRRE